MLLFFWNDRWRDCSRRGYRRIRAFCNLSGDDFHLRFIFAATTHQALHNLDAFVSSLVVGAMLLPETNVGRKFLMSRSIHQAALLHKFLHESVNFMIDLYGL